MSEKEGGGLKEMQERISGYHVYDRHYERVGKVDDLFVDANDELEYIGLAMGGMFKSKTALIPMELVRINDRRDLIEIEADKSDVEACPTFGKDNEITSDYEDEVHRHFGLQVPGSSGQRGSYGGYDERRRDDADPDEVDTEYGERAGSGESGERASSEHASSEHASREPRSADGRDDSSLSSRSDAPDRDAAAEAGGRGDASSGSPGGARVRRRPSVSAQREEGRGGDGSGDGLRIRKKAGGEGSAPGGSGGDADRRVR